MKGLAVSAETIHRCANLQCPNRMREGSFSALHVDDQIVSGHRGITLVLCSPCANALFHAVSG